MLNILYVQDLEADSVYTEQESGYANPDAGKLTAPSIVIDPPNTAQADQLEEALVSELKSLQLDDINKEEETQETEQKSATDVETGEY